MIEYEYYYKQAIYSTITIFLPQRWDTCLFRCWSQASKRKQNIPWLVSSVLWCLPGAVSSPHCPHCCLSPAFQHFSGMQQRTWTSYQPPSWGAWWCRGVSMRCTVTHSSRSRCMLCCGDTLALGRSTLAPWLYYPSSPHIASVCK